MWKVTLFVGVEGAGRGGAGRGGGGVISGSLVAPLFFMLQEETVRWLDGLTVENSRKVSDLVKAHPNRELAKCS